MTNKKFIFSFFASVLSIACIHLLFICYINPEQTAPLALSNKFLKYHDNFLLRKAKLMEEHKYETLILGSSTSEAFSVQHVNQIFHTSSFHGSMGGGTTIGRYVLFKKALENFPNMKRVFYIADFYEFNQSKAPSMLAYNDYLASAVEDKKLLPGKFDYMKYLFSHQLFDAAVIVYKRSKKGYSAPLLEDGSTTVSMILSKVQTDEQFYAKVNPANKSKLREEILENNFSYSRSVLANFKALDPNVKRLYITMVREAQRKNIEVIFLMSPYHYEFKKLLFENEDIKLRYSEWIQFFDKLKNEKGVTVYNPLSSFIATEPESGVWRDGIHFNDYAASYFLNDIAQGFKK